MTVVGGRKNGVNNIDVKNKKLWCGLREFSLLDRMLVFFVSSIFNRPCLHIKNANIAMIQKVTIDKYNRQIIDK